MTSLFGKLGFVHRELWRRDRPYRISLLAGPAPIVGIILAGAVWWALSLFSFGTVNHTPPPWATAVSKPDVWGMGDQPQAVSPAHPLPAAGSYGAFVGMTPGWQAVINAVEIGPLLEIKIEPTPLSGFTLEGPGIDMDRVLAMHSIEPMYVAKGLGYLAVRTAGIHAFSLRLERPAGRAADCVAGLGFAGRKVYSEVSPNLVNDVSRTFDPAHFDLQPGLYRVEWVFGCWHDRIEAGPGRMTLLIQHPGEEGLQPARPDEIIHPEHPKP
jgi:hypothetical protein